jgi:hypothetical protein
MDSHAPASRLLGTFAMKTAPRRAIAYVMAAVLVWGGLLALGAYLYGGTRQGIKAAIILGCVLAFLGLWALLLRHRSQNGERGA